MFKAASYVGHKICRPGDIVVITLWTWMAALGAARHTCLVSPVYGIWEELPGGQWRFASRLKGTFLVAASGAQW